MAKHLEVARHDTKHPGNQADLNYHLVGKDVLLLQRFAGQESISQPFRFHLDLISKEPSIPFDDIVGKRATVAIELADGNIRSINGFISRFSQSGSDHRFTHYHAELVPWLWFLSRTAKCRIFQNETVPQIIKKVFTQLGYQDSVDFRDALQGEFEPRDYCVQYRETDLNFVSRLMEQYGIFSFFEHKEDRHTLVLANDASVHQACPSQENALYDYTMGGADESDVITAWRNDQEVGPGRYTLTDYNFETPSTSLRSTARSNVNVADNGKYEMYDYPGEYSKKAQGEDLAKIRMEQEEAADVIVTGSSACRGFLPGYRFSLVGHYRSDMNQPYVLTRVQHSASVSGTYSSDGSAGAVSYSNQFTCIPLSIRFRPQRLTHRPFVQGPQTAVVVGKEGEEIWTDKYGRVKVQFHWDREGEHNEKSSCWIRVSHPWAGKGWGAIATPRIGQEVVVDFLEGDPDQPIITGRVYNAEQMPPYDLPGNQTQTGLKSRSSKGGGASNFNEIRFEDKKGSELFSIRAERDMEVTVERHRRELVQGDSHCIVEGEQRHRIDGDMSLEVKGERHEKVGGLYTVESGEEIHLKSSAKVVIEAATQVTIRGPNGFIDVGPAGIVIQGTSVLINSGGGSGATGTGANPKEPEKPDEQEETPS